LTGRIPVCQSGRNGAADREEGGNSPFSPETNRRENWWYYSQSGPGVYQGDVHFYSLDRDAREDIRNIDTGYCKWRC
jgi:hypothetical protein